MSHVSKDSLVVEADELQSLLCKDKKGPFIDTVVFGALIHDYYLPYQSLKPRIK